MTVPTSSSRSSIFSERPRSLGLGWLEEVGGVVADLLEAGEQLEHQAAAGLLVGLLDAAHRLAHERLVEDDLLAGQAEEVVGLGLGRQLGSDARDRTCAAAAGTGRSGRRTAGPWWARAPTRSGRPRPCGRRCGCRADPGTAQSRIDQSSVRSFSTGVPVSATRAVLGMVRSARAAADREFLMCWASSATTRSHDTSPRSGGVVAHRAVGREHEAAGDAVEVARAAVVAAYGDARGEATDLGLPVAEQRRRADDEGRARPPRCRWSAISVIVLPSPMSSARQAPRPSAVSSASQVSPWRW